MIARAAVRATALCAALAAATSWAGTFSVTPVRIFMQPRDRGVAVTVTNEGDEELVMQADVYTWKQKPGGEDDLVLSEDLILSPPIIKLAPRARQVVRLAMVRPSALSEQATYRMVVREIPEAKAADKRVQLQIALAFSLPVFITPPGATRSLDCTVDRTAPEAVKATCGNTGRAYAQVKDLVLASSTGDKLAQAESGAYILPGVRRSFEIRRAEGRLSGGKAKLVVNLDDGTAQTYDVSVPE